jgi:hypothetical protein
MNWFNLDDPVAAIALSKSQNGPRGVSTSRRARRGGYHGVNAAPVPADNPSRSTSFIIREILFKQPGSPLWS